MVRVSVVVGWPDVHKWRMVTQSKHAETKTVEDVDHASDAGKLAKRHHTLA